MGKGYILRIQILFECLSFLFRRYRCGGCTFPDAVQTVASIEMRRTIFSGKIHAGKQRRTASRYLAMKTKQMAAFISGLKQINSCVQGMSRYPTWYWRKQTSKLPTKAYIKAQIYLICKYWNYSSRLWDQNFCHFQIS